MKKHFLLLIFPFLFACGANNSHSEDFNRGKIIHTQEKPTASLIILGTVQDGGSPHIGCKKACCASLFMEPDLNRQVVSIGLFDGQESKYLFEATPDITRQIKTLKTFGKATAKEVPDGIFVTHAHIGHYTGLMFLGKEALGAKEVPVFVMPRMKSFLENNGPWNQLVRDQNIQLQKLKNEQPIQLSGNILVIPMLVPHRDEYSETVGYQIKGPNKTALFIPDIDKWEKWDKDILEEIKKVDFAFLDATFYSGKEINNRDISQIPHPFIIESLEKFNQLDQQEKQKVIFIHFNHTNPALNPDSKESKTILQQGYRIGRKGDIFEL